MINPAAFFSITCIFALILLDQQTLPAATCTWLGGSGNWSDPAKWSCGVVPDGDDDVVINSGTITLDLATSVQSINMTIGTLTLNFNLTITGNLTMYGNSSTTINGAGDLSIGGIFNWNRGTISGTGALSLTGSLTSTNGNFTLSRSALTLTSGGSLSVSTFTQANGADLTIPVGQTLTVTGSCTFSGDQASSTIVNHGIITTAGTGLTTFQWSTFTNDGTLNVNGSNVLFGGGPNSNTTHDSSMVNIASGKQLEFGAGTNNFTDTSTVSGAGTFKVSGNVNVNAGSTLSTIVNVASVTLTLNSNQTFPSLSVAGTLNLAANLTVTGNVDMPGGTINGAGNLTVNGNMTWSAGIDILGAGSLSLAGTLTANSDGNLGRSLTLTSGGAFTNVDMDVEDNAVLQIPSGQTLTINTGTAVKIFGGDGTGAIQNNGIINLTGGASSAQQFHNFTFTNKGSLTISGADLLFLGGSSSTHDGGTISLGSGVVLSFDGTTHNFINSSSVSGDGDILISGNAGVTTVTLSSGSTFSNDVTIGVDFLVLNAAQTFSSLAVNGGTVTLNAALTISGNASMTGGTIGGSGNLAVNGNLTWNGGTVSGSGAFTLAGTLTSSTNTSTAKLVTRQLTLTSGGTWTNFSFSLESGAILKIPAGQTLTISNTTAKTLTNGTGGGTLTNNGILIKTGSAVFNVNVPYSAPALISTTDIQQGTLDFNNTFSNGGTVKGTGTIDFAGATVSQFGEFSPGSSPGTLTIIGNYTNTYLEIEVASAASFDQLVVSGTAILGGTLKVIETGAIASGSWTILTAGTLIGNVFTFTTLDLPACYNVDTSGNTVILTKAVTKIWDGNTDNWSAPDQWQPYGVPCPLDTVVINGGVCNLDIQPQMNSLAINGGELRKVGAAAYATSAPTTIGVSGVLNIFQGTLEFNGNFTNDGTVEGFDTIDLEDATVLSFGEFAPGNSAGTLTVKGTYCNESAAMEIGNPSGGGVLNDLLEVTQTIDLGGALNVGYLGGTTPPGSRVIMECPTAGCRTGTFATMNFPPECQGGCSVTLTPSQVILVNTLPIEYSGTCTWLGGNGAWSNQANWSCNDVPNGNDTVVINSGQVMITGAISANSMQVSGGTIGGSGNLSVNGSLTKTGAGAFTVDVPFTLLTGGLVNAAAGILDFNSQFNYAGTVGGNGTIDVSGATMQALPGGNFSPGASPGTLNLLGNYVNKTLNMEISEVGGVVSKDLLAVSGNVNLSGSTLNILLGGTMPTGMFELLTFGSNPGSTQFSIVNFPSLCGSCSLVYSSSSVSVSNTQACIPNLTLQNMTVPTGTYRSQGDLISNLSSVASVGTVIFRSDTAVVLQQDFTVPLGAVFTAEILACPQNVKLESEGNN